MDEKIVVFGMGYVGLTLAVVLAEAGYSVIGVENNPEIYRELSHGKVHIYERGLQERYARQFGRSLTVIDRPGHILSGSDVYIVAVGTPLGDNGKADLSAVEVVCRQISECASDGVLVVVRSTLPVGTARKLVLPIMGSLKVSLVVAPERTAAGNALRELGELPQIIGGLDSYSVDRAAMLFRSITTVTVPVESLEAAELAKLVDNSFRDVRFAYANELAGLCEALGLDACGLIDAVNFGYERNQIPGPSPGVGGPCLYKDPYILYECGKDVGLSMAMVKQARHVNESQLSSLRARLYRKLEDIGKRPCDVKVFLMGFAFKGDPVTSDTRHSTTVDFVRLLGDVGEIMGHDFVVPPAEIEAFGVKFCSLEEGFAGADVAMIMNNHPLYGCMDVSSLLETMNMPALVVDCWHQYRKAQIEMTKGVSYVGIGVG